MNKSEIMPHFEYHLSNIHHRYFGCAVADHFVYKRISDFDEFYRALGYFDDLRAAERLPDEFIWDKYTRTNAAKSVQCLQFKIMAYLNNHSEKFRQSYGSEYANMMGKCLSDKIDNSPLCVDCPMHPQSHLLDEPT